MSQHRMSQEPIPEDREPRTEERLQAVFAAADPWLQPSAALRQQVAALATRHDADLARCAGTRRPRPMRSIWAAGALAATALVAVMLCLTLIHRSLGRPAGSPPRSYALIPPLTHARPATRSSAVPSPGLSVDRDRREPSISIAPRERVLHAPSVAISRLQVPSRGSASAHSIPYLGEKPSPDAPRWATRSADAWEAFETRVRGSVPVRDDFVTIPFPRLASTSDRQIAEAVASYEREAAVVDVRLTREVTLQQKATALSDLCERLRSDTGIQLAAGRSVADEKVTLFCDKMPLRDVMRQLSRPFGYTWIRSGQQGEYHYELMQDLRSQLLEEELRNRDRNEALLALEKAIERYRPYLQLSPDEALARAETARPADRELLRLLGGVGWGPIQMYFRLSPQDLAALRSGQSLSYSTPQKAGQQLLPQDLRQGVLQSQRTWRVARGEDGTLVRGTQDLNDPKAIPLTAAPDVGAMVVVTLEQTEPGRFVLSGRSGHFTPPHPSTGRGHVLRLPTGDIAVGQRRAARGDSRDGTGLASPRDSALRTRITFQPQPSCGRDLSPQPPPRSGEGESPTLPLGGGRSTPGRRVGRPTPAAGIPPRWRPDVDRPALGGAGGEVSLESRVTSADVLEALHRATGLPIVSDYYTRLYKPEEVSARGQVLAELLDRLADTMRVRWNKEGRWLQLRSATYYYDRLKEVPNRLLARWAAARRRQGSLSLEDLVEIAQLPDAQLDGAEMADGTKECFGLAEWELLRDGTLRSHVRFLGEFTPQQRQEAMTPAGLPFARMSLSQQQGFLSRTLNTHPDDTKPLQSLDELAGAALRVQYTQAGGFQWQRPDWLGKARWIRELEPGPQGHRVLMPPIWERTREAALQAVRRILPQVEPSEIYPTELDLVILYFPGTANTRLIHYIRPGQDINPG
jgi:hypothetical protein